MEPEPEIRQIYSVDLSGNKMVTPNWAGVKTISTINYSNCDISGSFFAVSSSPTTQNSDEKKS